MSTDATLHAAQLHDMTILEVVKSAPAALGAVLSAMTLNEWCVVAYLVIQVAYLLRKWYREEADWSRLKPGARDE